MRKVFWLFILLPGMLYAQVLYEDFESGLTGEWLQSAYGMWEADSLFPINGKFSLHHSYDNTESGRDMTGIRVNGLRPDLSETVWCFKIKHAYNPSSSNNWSFFLLSDKPPEEMFPGSDVSGYAVGVNLSGYNDTLCLWKIKDGTVIKTVSTSINWQQDIGVDSVVSLKIIRSTGGDWDIFIEKGTNSRVLVGTGNDTELFFSGWIGIMYEYSSSQDRKLWVDDIYLDGYIYTDTQCPSVDTAYFRSADTLRLVFSEPVNDNPVLDCFRLTPGNTTPESAIINGNECILILETELSNKEYYDLNILGICDLAGNCCDTVIENIPLAIPDQGDIIITEVMFDPDPFVALPPCEYIELYNASDFDLNMSGLRLSIGEKCFPLPAGLLESGEYILIVGKGDSDLFSRFGETIPIDGGLGLSNAGEILAINNNEGRLIHGVEYDIDWYSSQLKQYGGWSLELVDYEFPFSGRLNWIGSCCRSGGTPGMINSVCRCNPDVDDPVLENIYPVNPRKIMLEFTETMADKSLDPESWSLGEYIITGIQAEDPLVRRIALELNDSLKTGSIYEILPVSDITDIAGNLLIIKDNRLGMALDTEPGGIIFNEVMYDPLPGGVDFIEFYNPSGKIAELSDLFVVSYDRNTSDTGRIHWLSDFPRCLMPGDYYVITTDRDAITDQYASSDEDRIFEFRSLPSMPDKQGNLLLYNRNLILIDKMKYSDDMHFDMLSVTSGVSLELANLGSTGAKLWRSASATSGYATPGMKNSSGANNNINSNFGMSLSSRKISPDNDGFEDYLVISISSEHDQNIISLVVYNDMGYPVRNLANNISSGYNSVFTWEGCDDSGNMVQEGIYILCSINISPGRAPKIIKKVCTVVYY